MNLLLTLSAFAASPTDVVPAQSEWAFLDTGSDPGPGWIDLGFDDSSWSTGSGILGFGVFEDTTIDGGPPKARHPTTWFRHTFAVANPSATTGLTLDLLRDDGAVVYLNGVEVVRDNLPAGSDATTLATADVTGLGESTYTTHVVDPSLLVAGDNVLAVEVHQSSLDSDDLAFDLALVEWTGDPVVTRGPYLQNATPDSVVVRWRTDAPTEGHVTTTQGPQATGSLALDHEVTLSGLTPGADTTYEVGTPALVLAGPHTFRSPPLPGTVEPVKIWVIGDAGTADENAEAVRDAFTGLGEAPDLWLMLGDNAYNSGTDDEYQAAVFDLYTDWLPVLPLWSTLGNHDGYTADSASQTGPYYDIFTLPTGGEAGGEPSGTEAYYSFDWSNVHVVCLDSYDSDRTPGSAMLTWLEDDLAQTDADWIIAFWHHPPYSKGSHDSDIESYLIDMRSHALPILEAYGVDLVLSGHSHSYERSLLIDGHYGLSGSFTTQMVRDGDAGDPAAPYTKPSPAGGAGEGAVYAVAGSSGKISGGSLDHPVMFTSLNELGSMVIDVDGSTLTARFVDDAGTVRDTFAIERGVTSILELWADPDPVVEGQTTTLHAYGQDPDGNEVISYSWDFADGQPPRTGPDQVEQWSDDATVPITVTVEDAAGTLVDRTLELEVANVPPTIVDLGHGLAEQGQPTELWVSVTDVPADPVEVFWDFGDGATAFGTEVEHTFLKAGDVTVTVTASDDDGGETVETLDLTVAALPVDQQAIYVSPAEEGRPVVLSAGPGPDGTDPVGWSWDLHDGMPPLEGASVEATWPDDGSYPVSLTVTDADGSSATTTVTVDVANVAPSDLQLSTPGIGDEGGLLTFTASATDPGDDVLIYTWSFGDGSPDVSAPSPSYAYGDDGAFEVTVTVSDGDGGTTSQSTAVSIANLPPIIEAIDLPTIAREGLAVTLAATVSDPGYADELALTWSLGDGTTEVDSPVTHTYPGDGEVEVLLTVDDGTTSTSERRVLSIDNAPPELGGTPPTTATVGQVWRFDPVVSDPGDDPLTFTLAGPDGATVDEAGTVRWTPTRPTTAEPFTLTASDGLDSAAISWAVDVGVRSETVPPASGEVLTERRCGCQSPGPAPAAWGSMALALALMRRRRGR